MDDSIFVFEWILNGESNNKIVEEIPVSSYEAYLLENGTIAEEIFSACALKSIERKSRFLSFDLREMMNDFTGEFLLDLREQVGVFFESQKVGKENYIAINFYVLERIAFAYICDICQNNPAGVRKTGENDFVMSILNSIMAKSLHLCDESVQKDKFHGDPDADGMQEFMRLIEAIQGSNIKKSYAIYGKEKKCIALYKKVMGKELTVAFSGQYDCMCKMVASFFKFPQDRYGDYLKIANAIGAHLAGTSCHVSRYKFDEKKQGNIIRYERLQKQLGVGKTVTKNYYSCCERKIFAFLDNRDGGVYGGKLFVKYSPCRDCFASILYHITMHGKQFSMFIGLP